MRSWRKSWSGRIVHQFLQVLSNVLNSWSFAMFNSVQFLQGMKAWKTFFTNCVFWFCWWNRWCMLCGNVGMQFLIGPVGRGRFSHERPYFSGTRFPVSWQNKFFNARSTATASSFYNSIERRQNCNFLKWFKKSFILEVMKHNLFWEKTESNLLFNYQTQEGLVGNLKETSGLKNSWFAQK